MLQTVTNKAGKIRGSQIKQGKSDDGSESIENQTVTDKA
jgi:hypothetical protein